jgi:hypothetical protein
MPRASPVEDRAEFPDRVPDPRVEEDFSVSKLYLEVPYP